MREFLRRHPKTTWTSSVIVGLLLIIVIFLSLFNWNYFRPMLARQITAKTGRPASIDGDLKVHIFSWTPSAEVNGLSIGNPPWADRPIMFGAKRITVSVSLPRLLRGQMVLPQIALVEPVINLERDAKSRASWELASKTGAPTHDTSPTKLPTIRSLVVENGRLHVVDQIRKLDFGGSLIASDHGGTDDASAFQIRSSGTLNAKPFHFDANGGPLIDLNPDTPYHFATHITASDIKLDTQVTIPKPFDLSEAEAKFVLSGNDLADAFYLTGLALPNTPKYRLAATVHRASTTFTATDLEGTLGTSDIEGQIQVDAAPKVPKLVAKLESRHLNLADLAPTLGTQAGTADSLAAAPPPTLHKTPSHKIAKTAKPTGPTTPAPESATPAPETAADAQPPSDAPPPAGGLLLPDADLQANRVRGMDADVTYKAKSVSVPKVPMKEVNIHLVLDNGLLTLNPLTFVLDAGRFSGRLRIDARGAEPVTAMDVSIDDIDLAQFKPGSMKEAPLTGTLRGRFAFNGTGSSMHKFAAASDGSMSVVILDGQIREAFAELTGINVLKGLGLLISKEEGKTDIRCSIIDFKDHQGSLNTTTVYVDTTNVLITGRGKITFGDEKIDMALQGDPKKVRFLRLRSPISLHGTLAKPAVGLKADKLAEQAGIATALGILLTPAAAALAFIDPGLAKNKDCSTVIEQADAGVKN